jgi:HlyD family secretion protein
MSARRRAGRIAIWVVVILIAAAGGTFLIRKDTRSNEEGYRTEAVDRGDIVMTVTATGTLSAVTTVQVGSQVSGIISKLHADFNSRVKKGQLLAELDPTPFEAVVAQRRADLLQAQVQMRNAGVTFERNRRLLGDGLVAQSDFDASQADYEAAKAQVEQAEAALKQAETNLRYTKIISPIDGVVVDRQYDVGQTVAASFQAPTLFTIAQDLTKMQVQADVDQSDIGRIKVGEVARFTVDAYPEQEFEGLVTQIRLNATVNQNVVTYPVVIEVANPGEKLRPKMTADVSIEVARSGEVVRVPNAALRFRPMEGTVAATTPRGGPGAATPAGGGFEQRAARLEKGHGAGSALEAAGALASTGRPRREQTVYVLGSQDRPEPVAIRTGISDGRHTAVVGGPLEPGQKVIVGLATAKVPEGGRRFRRMF